MTSALLGTSEMLIERELVVAAEESEALLRADSRLRRVGFHPVKGKDGVYVRGSWIGSTLSSDPSHMRTRVTILAAPVEGGTRVRILQRVALVGQILTRPDVLFWKDELRALEDELRTGEAQAPDWGWARKAAFGGALVQMMAVFLPIWPALLVGWLLGPIGLALTYFMSMGLVFAVGVWKLRLGMVAPGTLSTLKAEPDIEIEAQAIDPEQLALDDFERRLFGDDPDAVKARIESSEVQEEMLEEMKASVRSERR